MAATGHNGTLLASEPATCTEDGYEDYYCETCGVVYTVILPATGHTWTDGGLVPYCIVCNYGREGDPIFWSLRNTSPVSAVEETYSYVYNGGQLTQMTKDGETLLFVYDGSGRPSELRYNSYYYHYVTNLQGDVIAILDEWGVMVVEYSYDAWGNILAVTGSMADTLGKLNPLTYRGYVYDWDTGLYYLQSRYYDPEMGRFINEDSLISTRQGFVGNNMFAYCNNNPVNYCDPCGTCIHNWSFTDCNECATFWQGVSDGWNNFWAWCEDAYETIDSVNKQQQALNEHILQEQLQMGADAIDAMLDIQEQVVENQVEAQYQQDMAVREFITDRFSTTQKKTNTLSFLGTALSMGKEVYDVYEAYSTGSSMGGPIIGVVAAGIALINAIWAILDE